MEKFTYEVAIELSKTKTCTVCSHTFTVDKFFRRKNGKYGSSSQCKPCDSARMKPHVKKYHKKNKVKLAEYHKNWSNENREHLNEYSRKYQQTKRDELKES